MVIPKEARDAVSIELDFTILPQPDDESCGPTCLHAVYRYLGHDIALERVIDEVASLDKGGTLGVSLANHALERGFKVTLYTYNLIIFDPTWFVKGVSLRTKLLERKRFTRSRKERFAIRQYLQFLNGGGIITLKDMNRKVVTDFLSKGIPILTGLSSTFLYRAARVYGPTMKDDDVRGKVEGHFVVLDGYNKKKHLVSIADPYIHNPISGTTRYQVTIDRVINAILLGVMTFDANFIIIEPQQGAET